MGTGRKRKNAGIGIDFKRAKHKVGKTLKKSSATDTTIKSQSIHVPDQSLAADKQDKAVTTRNLTLKDLVSQLGHYSPKVRRDALTGMTELFAAHPEELTKHVVIVIEAIGGKASDVDGAVRAALLKLLSVEILPKLNGRVLEPFIPLLMAHICSAMTHLAMEVRGDALKFLNELMQYEHSIIRSDFLDDCLKHFADMCGTLGRSQTLKLSSQATMLKVLMAVQSFLAKMCESHITLAAEQHGNRRAETGVLFRSHCGWFPREVHRYLNSKAPSMQTDKRNIGSAFDHLFGRLLSLLLVGSASLSDGYSMQSSISVQFLTAAVDALYYLLVLSEAQVMDGANSESMTSLKNLQKASKVVVTKICPAFPMDLPSGLSTPAVIELVNNFNMGASRLLLRLLLQLETSPETPVGDMMDSLAKYYSDLMKDSANPEAISTLALVISDVYRALPLLEAATRLNILWHVGKLCCSSQELQKRAPFLKFLLNVLEGCFTMKEPHLAELDDSLVMSWIKMMPKIIWEAGSCNIEVTKICISIIHHVARSGSPAILMQLADMQKEIILLFILVKESGNTVTARPGPLHQVPAYLQHLAVDILYFLPSLSELAVRTCLAVCLMECYSFEVGQRFLSVLSESASHNRVSPHGVSILIQGLVSGEFDWKLGRHQLNPKDWKRSMMLCSAACDLLVGTERLPGMLSRIEERLVCMATTLLGDSSSVRKSRLLFGLASVCGFFVCNRFSSAGSTLTNALPEIVALYCIAVVEDVQGMFALKDSPGHAPGISLLASCEDLFEKMVDWIYNSIESSCSHSEDVVPMEAIHSCQRKVEVLLSVLKAAKGTAIVNEKQQLTFVFTTLNDVLKGCRTGTEAEHKLQDGVGKCIALCEHQWGQKLS